MRYANVLAGLLVTAAASCSFGPALADDEIFAHPAGSALQAKAGQWITWRCEGGDVTEETHACVASGVDGVVIEERETSARGTSVTTLRYAPNGTLVAAWRGPAGGEAVPLRLVPPPSLDDYRAAANAAGASAGVSVEGVADGAKGTVAEELLETPAGRFACRVQRTEASALFMTARFATWHAKEPLPLSQLVQHEMGDSVNGLWQRRVLAAYGWDGAVPALAMPR